MGTDDLLDRFYDSRRQLRPLRGAGFRICNWKIVCRSRADEPTRKAKRVRAWLVCGDHRPRELRSDDSSFSRPAAGTVVTFQHGSRKNAILYSSQEASPWIRTPSSSSVCTHPKKKCWVNCWPSTLRESRSVASI